MNKQQDKGFTLIELLIVIVILGILGAVTVFAVTGITDLGQENACDVEAKTIETAWNAFYAQNVSTYPDSAAELNTQLTAGATNWDQRFTIDFDTPAETDGALEPVITGRINDCAGT